MSKQDKNNGAKKTAYPTQATIPAYPQQAAYSSYQPPLVSAPNPNMMAGMPPPPPSYDQAMQHPIAPPNYTSQPQQWNHGYPQSGQQFIPGMYPQPPIQNQYMPPHNPYMSPQQIPAQAMAPSSITSPATVVVNGGFDAGARFDSTSQVRIPPPPPGIAPNVAQMAQASGHNVVMGQKPDRFFVGGSDGGAVFW